MKSIFIFVILISICHFNVIVAQTVSNTNDSGAGSLRQAISDANSGIGSGNITFNIPLTDPNYDVERGVFEINIKSELPEITRNKLTIDGNSQTGFTGNTNSAILGSGGKVGVDNLALDNVQGPEIEIIGKKKIQYGLKINAEEVTIIGIGIYGFSSGSVGKFANIVLASGAHKAVITQNIIGSFVDKIEDPASERSGGSGITAEEADSVLLSNNIIAFNEVGGIYLDKSANNWLIQGNEILRNGIRIKNRDGIDLSYNRECKVIGNKITDNQAFGIDSYFSIGYHTIENNTITLSGIGEQETAGIRLYGKNNILKKNIITKNYGAGIMITSAAGKNIISRNSIFLNGTSFSDTGLGPTQQIGIDLLKSNENHKTGKAPFVSLNDFHDYDIGGNGLLNFPVLSASYVKEGNLIIEGWSTVEAEIEFFLADSSDRPFPQGQTYIFSGIEGSVADADSSFSQYGPGFINGFAQGTDQTSRFQFVIPLPENVTVGSFLTATATINEATSEFSGKVQVTEEITSVIPFAGCLIANDNNIYTIRLGYSNPNLSAVNLEYGEKNSFSDSSVFEGQPVSFKPGYHENVFTATFGSSGITWHLDGNVLILDNTLPLCPTNISISTSVSSAFVNDGDTTTIYIIAKNTSEQTTAGVIISAILPDHLEFLNSKATAGNYDSGIGYWNLGTLVTGDSASLALKVVVNDESEFTATLISLLQVDNNEIDNSATVYIGINASTGGEDGGIESNGNLATKIAARNFKRVNSNRDNARRVKEKFIAAKVKSGQIKAAGASTRTSGAVTPLDFIPEQGPGSTEAFITTPGDLIGITNASTVFAVDYLNEKEQRLGAILAITTKNGLYEHTKVICDRLNGAVLEDIWHTDVKDKPYIMFKLKQPGEEVDYAINFIVKNQGTSFIVDNHWGLEEYEIADNEEVFNMQIWAKSPEFTEKLLEEFIISLGKKGDVIYRNNYPSTIPLVYVKSGKYNQGKIQLTLSNSVEATELSVRGSSAEIEDGKRSGFLFDLPVSADTIGGFKVNLPVSHIFDAGFSVQNNLVGGVDVLYFADGPWGIDYEKGGAEISEFYTQKQPLIENEEGFLVERKAVVKGEVTTYASLFRYLRPGLLPKNLNQYTELKFTASGTGNFEVILMKKSVHESFKQYRKYITLSESKKDYTINFSELTDRNGSGKETFSAEDITAIVFNALGNQNTAQAFDIEVENVVFRTTEITGVDKPKESNENVLKIIPNPFDQQATLVFHLKNPKNRVSLEIFDVLGHKVMNLFEGNLTTGFYEIPLDGKSLVKGIYIARLTVNEKVYATRVVRQ